MDNRTKFELGSNVNQVNITENDQRRSTLGQGVTNRPPSTDPTRLSLQLPSLMKQCGISESPKRDGKDAEDEEKPAQSGAASHTFDLPIGSCTAHPAYSSYPSISNVQDGDENFSEQSDLEKGDVSKMGLRFCPFKLITVYPFNFVGKTRQADVEAWIKKNIWDRRVWEMFYLHDHPQYRRDALVMVPTVQFEQFLDDANSSMKTHLAIPRGGASEQFSVTFRHPSLPRPRFWGRVSSEREYEFLRGQMINIDRGNLEGLDEWSVRVFKETMDKIYASLKASKGKKNPEVQRKKKILKQKSWGRITKRVQRYLGLRTRTTPSDLNVNTPAWDVDRRAPFNPESRVKFVCVDVEAYERDNDIVTEIGLAVLDSNDIIGVPPGNRDDNWFQLIEAHHLRINEVSYMTNSEFIQGCPDSFNFGKSEFVSGNNIAKRIGQIMGDSMDPSPIVMVGHDIVVDLRYLLKVGFDPWKMPQFLDEVDTRLMFQRFQMTPNGRSLEHICSELEIPGHNFHNAGNDAVYTLRAMLAMAITKKVGKNMPALPWDDDEVPLLAEWTDGEDDDGGTAIKSEHPNHGGYMVSRVLAIKGFCASNYSVHCTRRGLS